MKNPRPTPGVFRLVKPSGPTVAASSCPAYYTGDALGERAPLRGQGVTGIYRPLCLLLASPLPYPQHAQTQATEDGRDQSPPDRHVIEPLNLWQYLNKVQWRD
jgi:hypothetical protein